MPGETIAEDRGRITDVRTLRDSSVEVSLEASGRILGVEYTELATCVSWPSETGVLCTRGQGVIMTAHGDTVFWTGEGAGRQNGKGYAARWRGSLSYQTASRRLARLNSIAAVFEREVDAAGRTRSKICEWK